MVKTKTQQNYFQRELLERVIKLIDRKEIFAIKGPRQSGKTTLLYMVKNFLLEKKDIQEKNIIFITLEDRDILEKIEKNPKAFVQNYLENKNKEKVYFLIDEVQYLKNAGQKMKLLYDLFSPQAKFIVTGSSSLELKDQTGKYLVGRVFSFYLWPLDFSEILKINVDFSLTYQKVHKKVYEFLLKAKNFECLKDDIWSKDLERAFEEYIIWGGYPEVIKTKDKETKQIIIKNIYDTYINRDIVDLLRIKSVENFRNIVRLLAGEIGNLVNYNNLADDSKTYFQELKQHLSVLEETYIVEFLKPYFKNPTTEIKKNPKVYFIDSGLRNFIVNNFNPLELRSDKGAIVENSVFNQLRRNLPENANIDIRYWRTIAKAEVDFIISSGKDVVPIEVKYSALTQPVISRSFRSFIEQYKPQRALVLTRGFWGEKKIDKTIIKFVPVWYL